jgi:hypothetical protein
LKCGAHGSLRGVDIEAGALPQVIGRIVSDTFTTRRGVRRDDRDPVLGGIGVDA